MAAKIRNALALYRTLRGVEPDRRNDRTLLRQFRTRVDVRRTP